MYVFKDVYDDVTMCYNNLIMCWIMLLILIFDLFINIIVVNLTPSAGIAALWASAGNQS